MAAALSANADAAERVREGNAKAIGPIVGHVMRETKGRADGARSPGWSTSSWGSQHARKHLSAGHAPVRHFGLWAKPSRPGARICWR